MKSILNYARESYFSHLRLYNYVLNNKQLTEVKKVQIKIDKPTLLPSLDEAIAIGIDRTEL